MQTLIFVTCVLVLFVNFVVVSDALKIGAFNIQTLGVSKYGKDDVMGYIVRVCSIFLVT